MVDNQVPPADNSHPSRAGIFCVGHSAPVAQLDRVPGYEPGGREFESLRARHILVAPWKGSRKVYLTGDIRTVRVRQIRRERI